MLQFVGVYQDTIWCQSLLMAAPYLYKANCSDVCVVNNGDTCVSYRCHGMRKSSLAKAT